EKEITPKSPSRGLGGDQQRVVGFQMEAITEQAGDGRIGWEKSNVGDLHHLVINGWNSRLVSPVDDVHEPITVVLDQGRVAVRIQPFGSEQANRDRDLRQSQK